MSRIAEHDLMLMADRLFDAREYEQALTVYENLLATRPDLLEALTGRALSLFHLARFNDAIHALQMILPSLPDSEPLKLLLAESLLHAKQIKEGQKCLEDLIATAPANLDAQLRLGRLHLDNEEYQEANRYIADVLEINPDHVEALGYMGLMMIRFCQFDEALTVLNRAHTLAPDNVLVLNNLGRASKMIGRADEALSWYRKALAVEPNNACVISNYLFALNYCAALEPRFVAAEHLNLASRCRPAQGLSAQSCTREVKSGRLRIGYVSGDYYTHSVTYFFEPVLQHHDRRRFEIYCYSVGRSHDATTDRLVALADCWREMVGVPPEALARQVREDGIDILVDLAGHTGDNRLGAFAMRPAPVQISWIGYPATTGLAEMDYYLTDSYCDPPGMTEHLYSERLFRLPRTFCCYMPPMEFPPVGQSPFLACGGITFGSFNNFGKVTGSQISLWARILAAVPGSRLYLKSMALGTASVKQAVLDQFATHGIAPERILMRVVTSTPLEHLAEYGKVDIALDTFPYNGTTTTCEALWMGTPVVSLAGKTHVSRVGVSLLENAGCPELIAATEDEYLQICSSLAADCSRLENYRRRLRASMACSPLLGAAGVTRELEKAFEAMYSEKTAGQSR